MALSTSSSDGSAPELMTVPGRGRGMSTLVTSAAAAAAALVVRMEGGGRRGGGGRVAMVQQLMLPAWRGCWL